MASLDSTVVPQEVTDAPAIEQATRGTLRQLTAYFLMLGTVGLGLWLIAR